MEPVYLVSEEEVAQARKMEAKLMALPPESGVLFVGVSVVPQTSKSKTKFRVWVGIARNFEEKMVPALVRVTLREEVAKGILIETEAHRGIARKVD